MKLLKLGLIPFYLLIFSVLLAACGETTLHGTTTNPPVAQLPIKSPTFTSTPASQPTIQPTNQPTVTPTFTATPTPTPTPTAVPILRTGDPRAAQLRDPEPAPGASCGVVDLFDFPIDPPDASRVSWGGGDFGVFRDRFDKFHAGEDWAGPSGSSTLGTPVYSIGHGLVTYAQALGWGRDQGVVIVQHRLADGRDLLSFYGHLDPDTVVLQPGTCIARGDLVGEIGDPRGRPHLHFEIRTQAPYQTLTGYWPEDPRTQGWLWPSQVIWEQRLATLPGVNWVRGFSGAAVELVGMLPEGALLLEDGRLWLVDAAGDSRNLSGFGDEIVEAVWHPHNAQLIVRRAENELVAYEVAETAAPLLLWNQEISIGAEYGVQLLPRPGGGVILRERGVMSAFDGEGGLSWQVNTAVQPTEMLLTDDALWLSDSSAGGGGLWVVAGDKPPRLVADIGGKLIRQGSWLWIYSHNGLYRLASSDYALELVYPLPIGGLSRGDVAALADGGLLLAHGDARDRRLLRFDPDGALIWQRSYAGLLEGDVRLFENEAGLFVAAVNEWGNDGNLDLYRLSPEENLLTLLFRSGTRTPIPGASWITMRDAEFLLHMGGGPLAEFTP